MTSLTTRPRNLSEAGGPRARTIPTISYKAGTHHERLLFLCQSLQGRTVTVQFHNGEEYDGILKSVTEGKELGVVLSYARLRVGRDDVAPKPSKEMVILAKNFYCLTAADVDLFEDETGMARKNKGEVLADTEIEVAGRGGGQDRELQKATAWLGGGEPLGNAGALGHAGAGGWDQFARNEAQFGVASTYNEELYTTKLNTRNLSAAQIADAERIAREIEGKVTTSKHVAEERGQVELGDDDMDEEDKYSTVIRPGYGADAAATPAAPAKKESKLRATAVEFVPRFGGASASPAAPSSGGFGSPAAAPGSGGGYPQMAGMAPAAGMTPPQQQQMQMHQAGMMQQQQQMMMQQQHYMQQMQMQQQQQQAAASRASMMAGGMRPMVMPGQVPGQVVMAPNGQPMMMAVPPQGYSGAPQPGQPVPGQQMMRQGPTPPRPPQAGYPQQMAQRPGAPGYPQ